MTRSLLAIDPPHPLQKVERPKPQRTMSAAGRADRSRTAGTVGEGEGATEEGCLEPTEPAAAGTRRAFVFEVKCSIFCYRDVAASRANGKQGTGKKAALARSCGVRVWK